MNPKNWPTWKTIFVDNSVDISEAYCSEKIAMCETSKKLWNIFVRIPNKVEDVELVEISGQDLGAPEWVSLSELCVLIRQAGLRRVAREVPYFARLQYKDQSADSQIQFLSCRIEAINQEDMMYESSVVVPGLSVYQGQRCLNTEIWNMGDSINHGRKFIVQK